MLGEGDDAVPAFVEDVVESAKRSMREAARPSEDPREALLDCGAVGRGKHLAELLFDLVGARERPIVREQLAELDALLVRRSLPRAQQQPSSARADGAQLVARAEEDLATQLIEHL